jgi:hypothetical protein
MLLAGIDQDDLAGGGKAPLTFISNTSLQNSHRMNPAYDGTEGTGCLGGWEKCEMRYWLHNTLRPLIPSVVSNRIADVQKYTTTCNSDGTNYAEIMTIDDIWIPVIREIIPLESNGQRYSAITSSYHIETQVIRYNVVSPFSRMWLRSSQPLYGTTDVRNSFAEVSGTSAGAIKSVYTSPLASDQVRPFRIGFCLA